MKAVVTGAGGFIGSHLVRYLKAQGYWVRGVDLLKPEYSATAADEWQRENLTVGSACLRAIRGVDEVYHLAADMGGIGYITTNHADLAAWNATMDANMAHVAAQLGVRRFFYASSACVYPEYRQSEPDAAPLREDEATPADPARGYGWAKLFAEHLLDCYRADMGLPIRIARFHNAYGPEGTWDGGKEKAPAALCRKVAESTEDLEIWGDGAQTRSFMYIDDCVEGIYRIAQADREQPLNLGSDEQVTITELAQIVCEVAGRSPRFVYDLNGPQGVRGRTSDNQLAREVLGWEPQTPLREGIERTYPWIAERVDGRSRAAGSAPAAAAAV